MTWGILLMYSSNVQSLLCLMLEKIATLVVLVTNPTLGGVGEKSNTEPTLTWGILLMYSSSVQSVLCLMLEKIGTLKVLVEKIRTLKVLEKIVTVSQPTLTWLSAQVFSQFCVCCWRK